MNLYLFTVIYKAMDNRVSGIQYSLSKSATSVSVPLPITHFLRELIRENIFAYYTFSHMLAPFFKFSHHELQSYKVIQY